MGFVEFSPNTADANEIGAEPLFNEVDIPCWFAEFEKKGKNTYKMFRELETGFPGSIYGGSKEGLSLQPTDFSHGAAMSDIVNSGDGKGKLVPLIGIELPREAILDTSGETLSFVCAFAVNKLIELMENVGGARHLVILLPYGFTGGPHDGSHPIVKSIETALANSDLGIRISLVLPTGNHLQSQSHAVIEATGPDQATEPLSVIIPPDDHSDNKFDLVTKAFTPPILILRSPKGEEFTVCFDKGLKAFNATIYGTHPMKCLRSIFKYLI